MASVSLPDVRTPPIRWRHPGFRTRPWATRRVWSTRAVHWAALDCPGFYGAAPPDYPPALLGRMTAEVTDRIRVGERCVVLGWGLGLEGRKIFAATALFGEDGRLVGRARQTWIRI